MKAADKETVVSWIESSVSSLIQKDIIEKSFKVCGITCIVDGSEDARIHSKTVLEEAGVKANSDPETEEELQGFGFEAHRSEHD